MPILPRIYKGQEAKSIYLDFSKDNLDVPLFQKGWWINDCFSVEWGVVVIVEQSEVIAFWPFTIDYILGRCCLSSPPLTQFLGPWLKYKETLSHARKLAYEKKYFSLLSENLPSFGQIRQSISPIYTNWLPFYWKGFCQSTRYTYRIDLSLSTEVIFSNFSSSYRNKLKKASKEFTPTTSVSPEFFYGLWEKVFLRQGMPAPLELNAFLQHDNILSSNNARTILAAVDGESQVHAALYLLWDSEIVYLHLVGENPILRKHNAGLFLIQQAILLSKKSGFKVFDFEGSMIESIECVRRDCGGIQTPYSSLTKTNSLLFSFKSLTTQFVQKFR